MSSSNWNYNHLLRVLWGIPVPQLFLPWEEVDCLEWDRGRHKQGYGVLRVDGVATLAHIAAYKAVNGPIPDGIMTLHHCDNPPCFHPAHLYIGTQFDNMKDVRRRGRYPSGVQSGSRNNQAKLTQSDVSYIWKLYLSGEYTQRRIAAVLSVSPQAINLIVNGKRWLNIGVDVDDV